MTLLVVRPMPRVVVITTVLSPVHSLASPAQHVPQPDGESRRGLVARLGRAPGWDARIDEIARCRWGRQIVNDEVLGWLHVAVPELTTGAKAGTWVLGVPGGSHTTAAREGRPAGQHVKLFGSTVVRGGLPSGGASDPGRGLDEDLTQCAETVSVVGRGRARAQRAYAAPAWVLPRVAVAGRELPLGWWPMAVVW